MQLTWKQKDFEEDLDFILFLQQDDKPVWWSKALFEAFPSLNYEYARKLPECERFDYIRTEMKKLSVLHSDDIQNAIKTFQAHWTPVSEKLNQAFSSTFGYDCTKILNDMEGFVGLDPVCPRNVQEYTFDVFYKFEPEYAIFAALHEITHFVWFYIWHEYFKDNPDEYDTPHLKWILSEIVVETIIRNSEIGNLVKQPKHIAYSYFYDMEINGNLIFDTMKNLYLERKDIYDFMEKSYNFVQQNEPELRQKISEAEKQ